MVKSSKHPKPHDVMDVLGRQISYREFGSGAPVIMLHGGGPGADGMSNYARNIDALAENFRVIVPDMPGYGASTKGTSRSDLFGFLANHIVGLMDVHGIESAHFVGNSLGGSCALRIALDQPHRVRRLVLMGPGGIGTTRGLPTRGLKALLNYYKGDGPRRDKLETFIREYLVFDGATVPADLIERRFEASLDPEVVASPPLQGPNSLKAAIRMDFTRDKRMSTLAAPVLVLWGSEDKVNRPSGGRWLASHLSRCDLYEFSETGHWVQWERAAEFNAVTTAFFLEDAS